MDDQLFITTIADGGIQEADGTPEAPDTVARSADFVGDGFHYLGLDDSIEFYPHSGGSGNGDFTITCFIRNTDLDAPGGGGLIFAKGPLLTEVGHMFSLYTAYTAENEGRVRFFMSDGTDFFSVSSANGSISQNTWHFVVVQYNGATDILSVEIDRGTPATTTSVLEMQEITASVRLGASELGDGLNAFEGQISMLGMWNTVLDSTALDELYNGGVGILYGDLSAAASPRHYLELDEESGTRNDSTPNEAHLPEVSLEVGSSLNVPS